MPSQRCRRMKRIRLDALNRAQCVYDTWKESVAPVNGGGRSIGAVNKGERMGRSSITGVLWERGSLISTALL